MVADQSCRESPDKPFLAEGPVSLQYLGHDAEGWAKG